MAVLSMSDRTRSPGVQGKCISLGDGVRSEAVISLGSETDDYDYLITNSVRSEVSALSDSLRAATDNDDDRPVR